MERRRQYFDLTKEKIQTFLFPLIDAAVGVYSASITTTSRVRGHHRCLPLRTSCHTQRSGTCTATRSCLVPTHLVPSSSRAGHTPPRLRLAAPSIYTQLLLPIVIKCFESENVLNWKNR